MAATNRYASHDVLPTIAQYLVKVSPQYARYIILQEMPKFAHLVDNIESNRYELVQEMIESDMSDVEIVEVYNSIKDDIRGGLRKYDTAYMLISHDKARAAHALFEDDVYQYMYRTWLAVNGDIDEADLYHRKVSLDTIMTNIDFDIYLANKNMLIRYFGRQYVYNALGWTKALNHAFCNNDLRIAHDLINDIMNPTTQTALSLFRIANVDGFPMSMTRAEFLTLSTHEQERLDNLLRANMDDNTYTRFMEQWSPESIGSISQPNMVPATNCGKLAVAQALIDQEIFAHATRIFLVQPVRVWITDLATYELLKDYSDPRYLLSAVLINSPNKILQRALNDIDAKPIDKAVEILLRRGDFRRLDMIDVEGTKILYEPISSYDESWTFDELKYALDRGIIIDSWNDNLPRKYLPNLGDEVANTLLRQYGYKISRIDFDMVEYVFDEDSE